MIALCTIASADDHLVEVPLQQAQVPYTVTRDGGSSTVLIADGDVDRAKTALERFGSFSGQCEEDDDHRWQNLAEGLTGPSDLPANLPECPEEGGEQP